MQTTDIDYLWDFQNGAHSGPIIPHPVFPLTYDSDSVGDLKDFVINAGSHGILPTRAVLNNLTLRRIPSQPSNNIDCKQIVSEISPTADTILVPPVASRLSDLTDVTL